MAYPSIFDAVTTENLIARFNKVKASDKPLWGKMNAAQMLAHLNVSYELILGERTYKTPFFLKIFAPIFFKGIMTNTKDYPKNTPTGKDFVIADERDFENEKARLIANFSKCHAFGPKFYLEAKHPLLGKLTAEQWNNTLYNHLDHHLRQFNA